MIVIVCLLACLVLSIAYSRFFLWGLTKHIDQYVHTLMSDYGKAIMEVVIEAMKKHGTISSADIDAINAGFKK